MAISKIILNGVTQMDLTSDTVEASNLIAPNTAHGADGNSITGSYVEKTLTTKSIITNGTYNASSDNADGYSSVTVNVPTGGGGSTLTTKTITQNGTYNASSDSADGYSSVTVNTPDAYSIDEVQNTSGTTAVIVGSESGESTPSATQHIVHLEYTDSTSENIYVYYNDSMFSTMITADDLTTHSGKTVNSASLDGVAWYVKPTETWETVLNDDVYLSQDSNNDYPYFWISELSNVSISNGSVWRITYDNVEYRLTAVSGKIGNPKWGQGTDDGTNVPFVFENQGWGAWTGSLNVPNVDSLYHFKIERLVTS